MTAAGACDGMDAAIGCEHGLVVERRRLAAAVADDARRLAGEDDLDVAFDGTPATLVRELEEVFDDTPDFAGDAARLVHRVAATVGGDGLRLRVQRIAGDACRRWHADNVVLRLLCTYVGPGTQILPLPEAAPVVAGGEPASTATAWSAGTGDVVWMPGRRHPSAAPVVHRSPPIQGTGDVRVLLVIDVGMPAPLAARE